VCGTCSAARRFQIRFLGGAFEGEDSSADFWSFRAQPFVFLLQDTVRFDWAWCTSSMDILRQRRCAPMSEPHPRGQFIALVAVKRRVFYDYRVWVLLGLVRGAALEMAEGAG